MVHGGIQLMDPVGTAAGSHIDLAADDGLDSLRFAGLVEVHYAVHDPVVGDGHGGLTQLLHPLDQQGNAAGAVQQGKLGMDVQVDKGHRDTSLRWQRRSAGDCRMLTERLGQIVTQDLTVGLLLHVDIGTEQNQEADKIAAQQRNHNSPEISV